METNPVFSNNITKGQQLLYYTILYRDYKHLLCEKAYFRAVLNKKNNNMQFNIYIYIYIYIYYPPYFLGY